MSYIGADGTRVCYAPRLTGGPSSSYFDPPDELERPEVTDEHLDAAIERMIDRDPEGLADIINNDAFWKDLFSTAATKLESWRKTLKASKHIQEIAQGIADKEAERRDDDRDFDDEPCHDMYDGR